MTYVKGNMHSSLGQNTLAMDTFWQADEFFIEADRKGLIAAKDMHWWKNTVSELSLIYFASRQLEAAKQCSLRLLSWPHASAVEHFNGVLGMAKYHKERKEWARVTEYGQEALALLPEAKKLSSIDGMEERSLLLLAEAAEEQGDMEQARALDKLAKKFWSPKLLFPGLVACYRRGALALLVAGDVHKAIHVLRHVPRATRRNLTSGSNYWH